MKIMAMVRILFRLYILKKDIVDVSVTDNVIESNTIILLPECSGIKFECLKATTSSHY